MMASVINSKMVINIPGNNIKSRAIWSDMVRFPPDLRCSQNLETWTPLPPPRPVVHALAHAEEVQQRLSLWEIMHKVCTCSVRSKCSLQRVQNTKAPKFTKSTMDHNPKVWWIFYPLISTSATNSFREPSLELALDLGVGPESFLMSLNGLASLN